VAAPALDRPAHSRHCHRQSAALAVAAAAAALPWRTSAAAGRGRSCRLGWAGPPGLAPAPACKPTADFGDARMIVFKTRGIELTLYHGATGLRHCSMLKHHRQRTPRTCTMFSGVTQSTLGPSRLSGRSGTFSTTDMPHDSVPAALAISTSDSSAEDVQQHRHHGTGDLHLSKVPLAGYGGIPAAASVQHQAWGSLR
jgi:hypothetical protein